MMDAFITLQIVYPFAVPAYAHGLIRLVLDPVYPEVSATRQFTFQRQG